jgi:hypothetical protein
VFSLRRTLIILRFKGTFPWGLYFRLNGQSARWLFRMMKSIDYSSFAESYKHKGKRFRKVKKLRRKKRRWKLWRYKNKKKVILGQTKEDLVGLKRAYWMRGSSFS